MATLCKIPPSSRLLALGLIRRAQAALKSTTAVDKKASEDEDKPPTFMDEDEEAKAAERAERLEKLRNKSRLSVSHRRVLMDQQPFEQPRHWSHLTLKYKRSMYGRYGEASGVDPRYCFYTPTELADMAEYERVAYPFTLQEMMEVNEKEKREKKEAIQRREDQIAERLTKLDKWQAELNAKIAKRELEAQKAKEKKERLIEEVRRIVGFKMDPRDDKFKELLAQKEKENRKIEREKKRKESEKKMLEMMLEKNKEAIKAAEEAEKAEKAKEAANTKETEKAAEPTEKDKKDS